MDGPNEAEETRAVLEERERCAAIVRYYLDHDWQLNNVEHLPTALLRDILERIERAIQDGRTI